MKLFFVAVFLLAGISIFFLGCSDEKKHKNPTVQDTNKNLPTLKKITPLGGPKGQSE